MTRDCPVRIGHRDEKRGGSNTANNFKRRRKNKEMVALASEVRETKAAKQLITQRPMIDVPTLHFRESLLKATPGIL